MTNHVHLIARAKDGFRLSEIIRDFKKYTANQLIEAVSLPTESRKEWMLKRFEFNAAQHQRNSRLQVWTHENHAEEIHSQLFFEQKMNYIHENPVRAAIVDEAHHYLYSSARNYAGLSAPIEIDYF
jgi:REP element-mobilizing transposase RayT